MDHERLAIELLRALRGGRSQVAFSRRLGYASNVAYTWESGRRFPTAEGFFHAVRRTGGDPDAALSRFLGARPAWADGVDLATPAALARVLDGLRGSATVSAVARRAGRHRAAVARWLAGQAVPRLPELLQLVDALTDRVLDFVACFVDPEVLPSARDRWRSIQGARALAGGTPWAAAVLLALELADYRALPAHEDGWIARRLGLDPALERACLDLLARAGQIRRVDDRWIASDVATVDTRGPGAEAQRLRTFWAGVARDRADAGAPGLLAWNLASVSAADLARIQEVQRHAFREVRAIVAASAPVERIVLLSWALVPLDDP